VVEEAFGFGEGVVVVEFGSQLMSMLHIVSTRYMYAEGGEPVRTV
jgi:hypothetical protein